MKGCSHFLDLQTFFVHMQGIEFFMQIRDVSNVTDIRVDIKIIIGAQLIPIEKYYATIGFYKTMIYNVKENGFNLDDLRTFAAEQDLDLKGLDRDQICNLL